MRRRIAPAPLVVRVGAGPVCRVRVQRDRCVVWQTHVPSLVYVGDVILQINGTRLCGGRTSAQVEALLGRTFYQVDRCLVLAPRRAPRVASLDDLGAQAG